VQLEGELQRPPEALTEWWSGHGVYESMLL